MRETTTYTYQQNVQKTAQKIDNQQLPNGHIYGIPNK